LASILEQALDYFFDEDIKLKNGDILIKKGNVFSLEIFLKIFNNLKHFEKKDTIIFSRLPSRNTENIGAEKQKKKNDSPVWPADRMEGVNLYRLRLRSKFGQSISVLIFFPLDETKTKDTEDSSILHPADFLNLLSFFVNLQQGVSKKRIDSDSLEFKKLKTCGDVFISLLKNRLSLLKKNCLKRFGEFSIIKKK